MITYGETLYIVKYDTTLGDESKARFYTEESALIYYDKMKDRGVKGLEMYKIQKVISID